MRVPLNPVENNELQLRTNKTELCRNRPTVRANCTSSRHSFRISEQLNPANPDPASTQFTNCSPELAEKRPPVCTTAERQSHAGMPATGAISSPNRRGTRKHSHTKTTMKTKLTLTQNSTKSTSIIE